MNLLRGTPAISVPGIPDDNAEFNVFDNWTFGLLRKALEVYATALRITPEALRTKCIYSGCKNHGKALEEELDLVGRGQRWKVFLKRETHRRMLLEPDVLDKVNRYETNLERSLFRNLHEIQRLQAARLGAAISPPAAIDVDLAVHQQVPVE
jgi:hypothetical protein